MHIGKRTWPLVFVAAFAATSLAQAKVIEDQRGSLKTLTSIGDALDAPDQHPGAHSLRPRHRSGRRRRLALLRESICTKLNLCAVERLEERRRGVCRQGRVLHPACSRPRSTTWAARSGITPTNGMRPRRLLCTGWCIFAVIARRSGGGRDQLVAARPGAQMPPHHYARGLPCRARPRPAQCLLGTSAQDPDGMGRFYPWITARSKPQNLKRSSRTAFSSTAR